MATYTLTINIESALTAYIGDSGNISHSAAGHMWYSVQKDNETPKELGFASNSGKPFDSGRIVTNDGSAYVGNPLYSRTIEISEEQYNKLLNPPSGFNTDRYDVVANNCISFTWEALKNAGFETGGFKGAFYPDQNSKYIDELFDNPSGFKNNAESKYNEYPTSINELGKTPPNNYPAQILDSIRVAIIAEVGLGIYGWEKMFDFLGDKLYDFLDKITPQWIKDIIAQLYDPIALDLDGDGAISVIGANDGSVYFDHDCDGVAFRSSWVSPNDGILVFDRNSDGLINNGSELFGNFTPKFDGNLATDGFNALSDFDTNSDGIISNLDENFDKLQIWQDSNSNGITDDGELKSLSEFDITSLNLAATQTNQNLGNGNTLTLAGSYTKTDGSQYLAADLNFSVDTINREFSDEVNLSQADLARPNIKGTGFLRDLRIAAATNEELANLLETYSVATTKQEQINLLDNTKKFLNLNLLVA